MLTQSAGAADGVKEAGALTEVDSAGGVSIINNSTGQWLLYSNSSKIVMADILSNFF